MSKDILEEASLVDLADADLKELLGATYHAIKNLEEKKKSDPDLERMREAIKQYTDDNYNDEQKRLRARMKAARALAAARGIRWKLPTEG